MSSNVHSVRQELENTDKKRDRLLYQFAPLEKSRAMVKAHCHRTVIQTASISSLPYETLAGIFRHGHSSPPYLHRGRPFEIIVSHVSPRWRDVAISQPNLWNRLSLSCHSPETMGQSYNSRSKSLTIDISVDLRQCGDSHDLLDVALLYRQLQLFLNRLRHLIIHSHTGQTFVDLMSTLVPLGAPVMQTLHVILYEDRVLDDSWVADPMWDSPTPIFCGGTPALRNLIFSGLSLHSLFCWPPLDTVKSLRMSELEVDDLMTRGNLEIMLNRLSTLTHLYMHSDHLADLHVDGSINLPSLELLHLDVQVVDGRDLRELFAALSVPSLQELVLENVEQSDLIALVDTSSGRSKRFAAVARLCVASRFNPDPSIWRSLSCVFPNLVQLALLSIDQAMLWNLLQSLNQPPNEPQSTLNHTIYPKLHTLSLDIPFENRNRRDVSTLYTLVQRRALDGAPLNFIQVTENLLVQTRPQHEIWAQIQELVEIEKCLPGEILSAHLHNWGQGGDFGKFVYDWRGDQLY